MLRENFTGYRLHRSISILLGFMMMLTPVFFDQNAIFYLTPFGSLFLFIYVFKATGKFSISFLIFLAATLLSEYLFLTDYEKNITLTCLSSIIGYAALLFIMKPVLKKRVTAFSKHNLVELIVGFITLSFVLLYIVYLVMPFIPETSLFLLTVVVFGITMSVCFIIPNYNLHPDNVGLIMIGGSYIAGTVFGFIYYFLYNEIPMLIMATFMMVFMKVTLATYITRFKRIEKESTYQEYM